jgi:hypothetical protein
LPDEVKPVLSWSRGDQRETERHENAATPQDIADIRAIIAGPSRTEASSTDMEAPCQPQRSPSPSRAAAAELIASSPSRPSADPYAGLPSNACGGFHLKLVNQMAATAHVALNGAWATEVPAGTTLTINEHVSTPQPPPLPWRVVITDVTTGTELFSAMMTGPVDQKVVLSSGAPAQTAYDLQSEGC